MFVKSKIEVSPGVFEGGSFNFAYYTASGLLIAAAIMVWFLRPPKHHSA